MTHPAVFLVRWLGWKSDGAALSVVALAVEKRRLGPSLEKRGPCQLRCQPGRILWPNLLVALTQHRQRQRRLCSHFCRPAVVDLQDRQRSSMPSVPRCPQNPGRG